MLPIIVLTFPAVTALILSFQFVCFLQYKKACLVPKTIAPAAKGHSLVHA